MDRDRPMWQHTCRSHSTLPCSAMLSSGLRPSPAHIVLGGSAMNSGSGDGSHAHGWQARAREAEPESKEAQDVRAGQGKSGDVKTEADEDQALMQFPRFLLIRLLSCSPPPRDLIRSEKGGGGLCFVASSISRRLKRGVTVQPTCVLVKGLTRRCVTLFSSGEHMTCCFFLGGVDGCLSFQNTGAPILLCQESLNRN